MRFHSPFEDFPDAIEIGGFGNDGGKRRDREIDVNRFTLDHGGGIDARICALGVENPVVEHVGKQGKLLHVGIFFVGDLGSAAFGVFACRAQIGEFAYFVDLEDAGERALHRFKPGVVAIDDCKACDGFQFGLRDVGRLGRGEAVVHIEHLYGELFHFLFCVRGISHAGIIRGGIAVASPVERGEQFCRVLELRDIAVINGDFKGRHFSVAIGDRDGLRGGGVFCRDGGGIETRRGELGIADVARCFPVGTAQAQRCADEAELGLMAAVGKFTGFDEGDLRLHDGNFKRAFVVLAVLVIDDAQRERFVCLGRIEARDRERRIACGHGERRSVVTRDIEAGLCVRERFADEIDVRLGCAETGNDRHGVLNRLFGIGDGDRLFAERVFVITADRDAFCVECDQVAVHVELTFAQVELISEDVDGLRLVVLVQSDIFHRFAGGKRHERSEQQQK